jgi:hypothetical protein
VTISRGASPAQIVPTRNVITRASAPRLIGRTVPMTKTITSPMTPIAWMDTRGDTRRHRQGCQCSGEVFTTKDMKNGSSPRGHRNAILNMVHVESWSDLSFARHRAADRRAPMNVA